MSYKEHKNLQSITSHKLMYRDHDVHKLDFFKECLMDDPDRSDLIIDRKSNHVHRLRRIDGGLGNIGKCLYISGDERDRHIKVNEQTHIFVKKTDNKDVVTTSDKVLLYHLYDDNCVCYKVESFTVGSHEYGYYLNEHDFTKNVQLHVPHYGIVKVKRCLGILTT